jgi:hypothetical protein
VEKSTSGGVVCFSGRYVCRTGECTRLVLAVLLRLAVGVSQAKLRQNIIAGRVLGIGPAGGGARAKETQRLFLFRGLYRRS